MRRKRPPYAAEFRAQMIELVGAGRTPEELSREFEPSAQAIRNWVAQADRDAGRRSDGLTGAEREELRRLKRENRRLRQERGGKRLIPSVIKNDRWAFTRHAGYPRFAAGARARGPSGP